MIIRCGGRLNTNVYWKIGDYKIYLPLTLIRAIVGMMCGCYLYDLYKKLSQCSFTKFAKNAGITLSAVCMAIGIALSAYSKEAPINSHSWRTLIVVLLYMVSVELAFLFGQSFPANSTAQKICGILGKWSLPLYASHECVLYLMKQKLDMPYFRKRWMLVAFAGAAASTVLLELCVKLLRKSSAAFMVWLKKMCIAEPVE